MQLSISVILMALAPLLASAAPALPDDNSVSNVAQGTETTLARRYQPTARPSGLPLNSDQVPNCDDKHKTANWVDLYNAKERLKFDIGQNGFSIPKKGKYSVTSGEAIAFICNYNDKAIQPTAVEYENDFQALTMVCGGHEGLGYIRNPRASFGRTSNDQGFC